MSPSEGISVYPKTKPFNSAGVLGLVRRLTITVTTTQIRNDHRARYIFSAISLACGDSAIHAILLGSIFTSVNMATDDTLPANNPQNPPLEVPRFHSIPISTVPKS